MKKWMNQPVTMGFQLKALAIVVVINIAIGVALVAGAFQ